MLLGVGISFLIYNYDPSYSVLNFNTGIYYNVIIPLILFGQGFSVKDREYFLNNIENILKFGLLGTFFVFIISTGLNFLVF